MTAAIQHADALKLLDHLEFQILRQPTYIITYSEAGVVLGRRNPTWCGRHIGQVASRLDAACLVARVPFLGMHRIRTTAGRRINMHSFGSDFWTPYIPRLITQAREHRWTKEDFKAIRTELNRFGDEYGAAVLWQHIEGAGMEAILKALGVTEITK